MSRWPKQVEVERSSLCTCTIVHTPLQISCSRIVPGYSVVVAGGVLLIFVFFIACLRVCLR